MKRSSTSSKSKRQTVLNASTARGSADEAKLEPQIATSNLSRRFWVIVFVGFVAIAAAGGALIAYRSSLNKSIADLRISSERARRNGDWPELERLARQWANLEPNRVAPWTMAAAAARAMGELELCAQYLAQLPDTAPVEAFHELSLLQMETLVQPLAARDTCQRALKQHPSDIESSTRLLFIHAMMCDRDALIAEAERAIRAGADSKITFAYWMSAKWLTFNNGHDLNRFWLEKQSTNEAFEIAAVAHQLSNRDLTSATNPTGASQTRSDSTSQNQKLLQSLLDRYPSNKELLAIALANLIQAGDTVKFSEVLSSAPAETATDNRFWRFKGWLHSANEEWDESIQAYGKAIELWPVDFASQNELAGVLRKKQGVEVAKDMQLKATLGTEVALSILRASSFESIPDTDYKKMAEYMELCGKKEFAQGLRRLCE
jgi:tetratricopeptide (TPR) repeat protein